MRADRSTVGADFSTAHVHSPMGGQGMDAGLQVAHHLVNPSPVSARACALPNC